MYECKRDDLGEMGKCNRVRVEPFISLFEVVDGKVRRISEDLLRGGIRVLWEEWVMCKPLRSGSRE